MPQANNYLTSLGQARAVSIIAKMRSKGKITVDPEWGCELATSGLRPDGYASTKAWSNAQLLLRNAGQQLPRHSEVNFLLHRVSFLAMHGRDTTGVGSHLCSHKNCLLHVVDEPQSVNVSRSHCPPPIVCPRHDTVLWDDCQHNPKCLKTPEIGNCCLDANASMVENAEEGAENQSSQATGGALSDILSRLGDPSDLPGSQYLILAEEEEGASSVDSSEDERQTSMMETSMISLSLNADEDREAQRSSPPLPPVRRRYSIPRIPDSQSSQLPSSENPSNSPMDSFIVDDDVVIYDTSFGQEEDSDS